VPGTQPAVAVDGGSFGFTIINWQTAVFICHTLFGESPPQLNFYVGQGETLNDDSGF